MKLFTATWCNYCKPVKQLIEENKLDVEIVDIDQDSAQALSANITQIPALMQGDGSILVESESIMKTLKEALNA